MRRTYLAGLSIASLVVMGGCPLVVPDLLRDNLAEGARLAEQRITQEQIASKTMSLAQLRDRGMKIFTMPFSKEDGYGDGVMTTDERRTPGDRPTLQDNGSFLRVNGLDGQSCVECHSVLSNASIPPIFGIGGVGSAVTNAIIQPTRIDVTDTDDAGFASFDGRFANPPFLFGSGGIELLAKEMTMDLQALEEQARNNPGTRVALVSKGIGFGFVRFENGTFDTSEVRGVDDDLVVRPFGRKGEFSTVRKFDVEAMQFHFGMQPVEVHGEDTDPDADGIMNEVTAGDLSALHVFNVTLKRPFGLLRSPTAERGRQLFQQVGCADCHIPTMFTERRTLPLTFPEDEERPFDNEYMAIDLADVPGFALQPDGGVAVPLFSDLKRHDMGDELAESFGMRLDRVFVTARLWGIADTAPYLHDGRAMTLGEAILMHGGEGEDARDAYAALSTADQNAVIEFLRTLRTPLDATNDLE